MILSAAQIKKNYLRRFIGAPNAMVGIYGVDKAAYFLHEQERLTRQSMFGKMEDYDIGCVRNGGSNAKDVFVVSAVIVVVCL